MTVNTASSAAWYALDIDEVLARLQSSRSGISTGEARALLAQHGPNTLPTIPPVSSWVILIDQLKSVFAFLLAVAAILALLIGDPKDAIAVFVVMIANTIIGFMMELRARRAVEALRSLEARRVRVVRDGAELEIDARDLVPGDVVVLEAGWAVPADARLISSAELRVTEASLTGESVPVNKTEHGLVSRDAPIAERENMVFLGSAVVAGDGRAVVTATGENTEVGRIGQLVSGVRYERTPLEKRLDVLGRQLAVVAIGVAGVIAVVHLLQGMGIAIVLRTSMAIAIAAVPEGLPAVVTVAMAIGVHRMARRHALIRRLPTIESLGSVSVICTDKTGTLTTGEMTVTTLSVGDRVIRVTGTGYAPSGHFLEQEQAFAGNADPAVAELLRIAALANRAHLACAGDVWTAEGDPTEAALLTLASKGGLHRAILLEEWPEAGELPFSSERMLMATYHLTESDEMLAHVKGSPSHVLELCDKVVTGSGEQPLDSAGRQAVLDRNDSMASSGLRVLGFARGLVKDTGEHDLHGLTFIGLAGMIDAPAPGVPETIQQLHEAGIRPVMLTGDQRRTAEAIAEALGILGPGDETLDGSEVERLADAELSERVDHVAAYSRVSPESKLRIVTLLQSRGQIVAMLGDGVNDAAALKKADVGVAMGKRGTDVAREVAGVVLEDDRFATISGAIESGRVIFDNIRKFAFYLFSCNLGEIVVLLFAGLAGLPLPLLPLQLLWLNLVTDTFPALSLAFEPPDADVMRRAPRDPRSGILSGHLMRATVGYAVLLGVSVLGVFIMSLQLYPGMPDKARTMAFMTLGFAQLTHLVNARSDAPLSSVAQVFTNSVANGAVALVIAMQVLAVVIGPLRATLDLVPLAPGEWLIVSAVGLLPAAAGQIVRRARRTQSIPHADSRFA